MEVLVTILNKTDCIEDLLRGFMDEGITGSTIMDSIGMGRALMSDERVDLPVLTSLRTVFMGSRPYNKTILTVLRGDQVDKAFDVISKVVGDMNEKGVGLAFTLPIGRIKGLGNG